MAKRTRLIELRRNKSRTQIAKELGITPQMLGAIERGDRDPSLRLAKKIADYYKVSIDEIFFNSIRHKVLPKSSGETTSKWYHWLNITLLIMPLRGDNYERVVSFTDKDRAG